MTAPPPLPPPLQKRKIPTWVLVVTVLAIVLLIAMYAGIYFAVNKANSFVADVFNKANPEFELLHIANYGRIKIRHKASGREFLVEMPKDNGGRLRLQTIANQAEPAPAWLKLRDAEPYEGEPQRWSRSRDTGFLNEAMEDLLHDHDFEETGRDNDSFTFCNPKLVHCVIVRYGNVDASPDNRSWYSVKYLVAP